MRAKTSVNFDKLYNEIEKTSIDHEYKPEKEPNWWEFISNYKFWLEVAKIIFKFIFKV